MPAGFDPVAGSPPAGTTAGTTDSGRTTTVVVTASTTVGSVDAGAALVGAITAVVVGAAVVVVGAAVVVVGAAAVVVVGTAVVVVGFAVVLVVVVGCVRTNPPAANALDGTATAIHTIATPKIVLLTCSPSQFIRCVSTVDTHRGLVEIGWNLLHKTHKLELPAHSTRAFTRATGLLRAEGFGATPRHRNPRTVLGVGYLVRGVVCMRFGVCPRRYCGRRIAARPRRLPHGLRPISCRCRVEFLFHVFRNRRRTRARMRSMN
jgi:hypothetical protein